MEAIPLRRAPTDLHELLTSSLEVLQRQASNLDVAFTIEASSALPKDTCIDPEKIAWAVATLVGNALRYVRPGTRLMPGGSVSVQLSYVPEKDHVVVRVQDDGPGIPADKLPWLFQRAHGKTHAAGLGLMLIHDVVTAHGGSIDVKSRTSGFEHGTSITLQIPAHGLRS
ncbi:HAMP domain-containing histidine kinase [Pendulispora rubella]|uniref:HAMP domain-containing histidine kinase n=1 Tax=Pendulispora rubella TaxID=2741070 RepID=A0ABZ2L971_9BACT